MNNKTDHPFQPGVADARIRGSYGDRDITREFIDKVRKTGHVTVKGSQQLYRVHNDGATETGGGWGSRALLQIWTEDHAAQMAQQDRSQSFINMAALLNRLTGDLKPTDEQVKALSSLLASVQGAPKS